MKRFLLYITLILSAQTLLSQNLLTNGTLESGVNGVGFNVSGAGYNEIFSPFTGITLPGDFALTNNPVAMNATYVAGGDHTTGTGTMLIVEGQTATPTGQPFFWENGNNPSSNICGLTIGNTYVFSYWIKSVSSTVTNPATQANIQIAIDNALSVTLDPGSSALAPLPAAGWQKVTYTFVATDVCAHIGFWNSNISALGNAFAVDDFTLLSAANVSGSISVCPNTPNPTVTFTANVGVPPYTFTYNINGGPNLTAVTGAASNTTTVSAPTSAPGTFEYNLVSVAYSGAPVITIPQQGTATIVVNLPSVSIGYNTTILPGGSAVVAFLGLPGTGAEGATVTFTASSSVITPAQTFTIVLGADANANYSVPYLPVTTTYSLVSVTTATGCIRALTGTTTITVNSNTCALPLVDVTIGVPSPVCNPGECTELLAQYSNVGTTTNYVVTSIPYCPSFPFTGGTPINAVGDDAWSPIVNLPFDFNFFGTCYDKVLVGTNGVITFDLNNNMPSGFCEWSFSETIASGPIAPGFEINNAIYGVYQDTDRRSPPVVDLTVQNVNYYVLATGPNAAPNRVMVANFNELPQFGCGAGAGLQTSQIVIHETTNIIEVFVNKRTPCNTWQNGVGVIGVQNQAGSVAVSPPARNTGAWSATNEAWRFIPRNAATAEIRWEMNGFPIPGSVGQNPLLACPPATGPTVYTAIVKYADCVIAEVSDDVTINVTPPLAVNDPIDIYICSTTAAPYTVDIDQTATIFSGVTNPGDYVVKYYEDRTDAVNDAPNNIPDANLSTYTFSTPNPKVIYVRIEDLVTTGCYNIRPFKITIIEEPEGTILYPSTPYCNSITTPQPITETGLTTGGTYSAVSIPPGLYLEINATTGAITPSLSQIGSYTVTYHIDAIGTCPAFNVTTPVQIVTCGCTASASASLVTLCEDTLLPPITYTTPGAVSASVTTGTLPAGVTGNFVGGIYTISGTPTTPGTYDFVVTLNTLTDACTANTRIIVNDQPNAGVDGSVSVCAESPAPIDLFNLITGEEIGGSWTRTSGTGGIFNAAVGTFTPAPNGTTSSFTYTLAANAPCINDTSLATVNIVAQPSAGTSGTSANVCDGGTTPIDLFALINGEQSGGTWTRTSGIGGVFSAAAATFTPAAGATTSTFTYTINGVAPCGVSTSLATVNITAQLDAGTSTTAANVCDSSTIAIDLYSLINGEQPGGIWSRTTGTGGIFNATAGTFTPTTGASTSTFTYTLTGVAPCISDSSIATINITAQPEAGLSGTSANVCETSTIAIDLYSLITGEQPGGIWTRTTGTGGTFSAGAATFTPAINATTSTFTYTLTGTAPCINSTSLATINITAQPVAGTSGVAANVCDSSITAINLFTLINGEQPGGIWTQTTGTGGTFNAVAGTFTPALGATTSTFTYTITGTAPCINDSSLATVTITAQPDAGISGTAATVCDNSTTAIDLFNLITGEQLGGTWTRTTGIGGVFNSVVGTFTPAAGTTTSTFTYTLIGTAPCINDSSIATINIIAQPVAGLSGTAATVCDSSTAAIDLFSLISGEQLGGTWTRTTGSAGAFNATVGTFTPAAGATSSTFTYTVAGTAPCLNDSSVATININAQPEAGSPGTAAVVCDSSTTPIDLFSLITGEQPGGIWTQTTGTGGVFNATVGTFTPAAGATSSTFTYTLGGIAPCVNDSSVASINISAQANAGTAGTAATVCDSSTIAIDLFSLINGEQLGGTWTRTSGIGGTFNAATGTFTPGASATSSTFTYMITGTGPCSNVSSIATININAQPDAGASGTPANVCDSSTTAIDLFSLITGEQPGGTWTRTTGTGGTFNAATGTFTPATGATTSTFNYTLTGTAPCVNANTIATVNIVAQPNAGSSGTAATVCDSSTTAIDLFSLITGEQLGGTWTKTTGTGGTFNALAGTYMPAPNATTSTFTYTLMGTSPCVNQSSVATINVNAQPDAGTSGTTITVCDSSVTLIDLFSLIDGEQSGGIWTRTTGTGGVLNATTGAFTPTAGATTSTFTYTLTGTAPCLNDSSIATIIINAQPDAGTNGTSANICDSSTVTIDLFGLITGEQLGGTWTRTTGTGGTFNMIAGTFIPAAGATSSTFTYTVTGVAPCVNDSSLASINISTQPNAGTNGTPVTVCDSSSAAINLFSLINGEQLGGTWTRTTGTGGSFNAGAATYIPASGATTSTFTYTLTGTAPCPTVSSVATVNINAQPEAGTNGSVARVCESSTTTIDLFSLINGEQSGGIWTRITGIGGTFSAVAGTFTPAIGATSSTFRYTLTGTAPCIVDTSVASILIDPSATITLTTGSGNQTICINTPVQTTVYTIGNGATNAAITSGGLPAGVNGLFNPIAGTFTISGTPTQSGVFNYLISTSGGCPSIPISGVIRVNTRVTMVLDSGVTTPFQTKCINESITTITYLVGNGATGAFASSLPPGLLTSFNAANNTFTISGGASAFGTYNFTVTTIGGCGPDVSLSGTITINQNVTIALDSAAGTNNQSVCINEVIGDINYKVDNGATSASITSGTVPTGISGSFNSATGIFTISGTPAQSGTFNYTVQTSGGCSTASLSGTITVNPLPVIVLEQNGYICVDVTGTPLPGASFTLHTNLSPTLYSFIWRDSAGVVLPQTGASFAATVPGAYSVEVTNTTTNCTAVGGATIVPSLPPATVFAAASSYFSESQVITVTVTPVGIYEYQLDNGAYQDSNEFFNVPSGLHIITVRDKFKCGEAKVDIRIIDYPRFFTPNADGYNDTWNIPDLYDQPNSKIYIFDRYGKLLKEISPLGAGWDGTFNAQSMPGTDYWFQVFFKEAGVDKIFKSHFSLKR